MAHNIYGNKIAYSGERPWHGIGTSVQGLMTSAEAIVLAKLGYKIEKQPIFTQSGAVIEGKKATVNMESGKPLGIVSDRYSVVQNVEAFDFFDSIVGESKAMYEVCGALGHGERIWLLAKLPNDTVIFHDDVVEKYLCLTTTHDGTGSIEVYFTPTRVVCQNTLTASFHNKAHHIAIRHIGKISNKLSEARKVLGFALEFYTEFDLAAQAMAEKKIDLNDTEGYFNRILDIKIGDTDETSTRKLNMKDRMLQLFEHGKGNDMPAIRHSVWTLWNSVTEFADHYMTVKGTDPSNRLKSIWFGAASNLKERAFTEALALVK